MSLKLRQILSNYNADNQGTKINLARIINSGSLAGTGKIIILPVDQGFEHGPDSSFAINPVAYDPKYHINLAIEGKLNAYAAPLGMLEAISDCCYAIPLILKLNSSNSLTPNDKQPDQAFTSTVIDAVRLGCVAVGITIYPGSEACNDMIEEAKEIIREAKSLGLVTMVWSYPRGGSIPKEMESALDVVSYAAHIAALIGAHIIKVKLPTESILSNNMSQLYQESGIIISKLKDRIENVMRAAFNYRRIVLFSGGAKKDDKSLYNEIEAINSVGGYGSIIGRNTFQRKKEDALKMLDHIIKIYSAELD